MGNSSEYYLTDPLVSEALNRVDQAAEEAGVDYSLGGGFAVQSYLIEGIAERRGKSVNELSTGDVARHLRPTTDLDMPMKSYGNMPEFRGNLFSQGNKVGGELKNRQNGKYFGEMELFDEDGEVSGIDLNIFDGEAKGFSDYQFDAQFENGNRYDDGRASFNRVGLENLVWMKADSRREKDIADLAYLMQLKGEDVDDEYMNELIGEDEDTRRLYESAKDEDWRNNILEQLTG